MSGVSSAIECPICMDTYTDPRSLPCGHTFYLDCLHPLHHQGTIPCPTCRHQTPVIRVQDLTKPYALLGVLEALSIQTPEGAEGGYTSLQPPQPEYMYVQPQEGVQVQTRAQPTGTPVQVCIIYMCNIYIFTHHTVYM